MTVSPSNSVGFTGKLYLLVDRNSFSAADAFAAFCKSTKFAKIVGERTGGGGIGGGLDLPILALPNSGYVVRFSCAQGLNPDAKRQVYVLILTRIK